ncbi:prolyl oligopeptidase family serine peptidase [Balneola sp. MJW-20]|uniref:S9 family peptidase n=1 Tax=Gracilimonas aurantiaca TaxID=3234185 RepID=UPI0034675E84
MRAVLDRTFLLTVTLLFISLSARSQGVLTFEDVMKFDDIGSVVLSEKGDWTAYEVWPDRGDGIVRVKSTNGRNSWDIPLGASPRISGDGAWVAAYRKVPLAVSLSEKKDIPVQGLTLLSTEDGTVIQLDSVRSFQFSEDGKWLAVQHMQSKEVDDLKSKNKRLGTEVILHDLGRGDEYSLDFVREMAFDSLSQYLAYTVVDTSGSNNGLYYFNLKARASSTVDKTENGLYANLTWDHDPQRLAFTKAEMDTSFIDGLASLHLWSVSSGALNTLLEAGDAPDGYHLRTNNQLVFTNDGNRLFFGVMDQDMSELDMVTGEESDEEEVDIYDIESIVEDRGMDLWHGEDPLIKPQEIVTWNRRKDHLYTAVYHLDRDEWVQLADKEMPDLSIAHNDRYLIGYSDLPYRIEQTWDGGYRDYYRVDVNTGERMVLLEHFGWSVDLAPGGKYAAYYDKGNWYLMNMGDGTVKDLTGSLENPFYDEDHDYPSDVPGYGVAGWVEDDRAVMIYDKYDIWKFDTDDGKPVNLTKGVGRAEKRIFRIEEMNKENFDSFGNREELLLTSYHDLNKNFGFYSANVSRTGVNKLLEEDKKFSFVKKADEGERILYKREAYDEFPNLWVAENRDFRKVTKLSKLHEDLKEKWNWGSAELIDWLSVDGTYIQGVVIKPDNYDPDKKYPVMTYYYRFFTDRLHDFNEPKTNHRPVFAQYVSDEYLVFLPDIRFEIGRPGFAATKSLVPGIQKLIEMGLADKDKIGLHGHSWSGYQTAFMVTQTDIFAAAVSGAPVSNMTSAYSGIRWASGRARQFQYEKTQSRIGESLVGAPEKYIENSPVFFADKINTPMLIQHGDADGAVPWYQSIELYLAMRRFDKDVVFLQYHDEPHHLQKFPNKLDYAIRMKEYFDYYLKGEGEPEWILKGEAYVGK